MPEAPEDLDAYSARALGEISGVSDAKALEAWYRAHLAPSGAMNAFRKRIGTLPVEERKPFGARVNQVATALKAAYDRHGELVSKLELERSIQKDSIDVSLPSRPLARGGYHPITLVIREFEKVFNDLGFATFESRHAELDEFNFELLNMPPAHPARDMQDTFYLSERAVLRTHTSAGQIHAMRRYAPGPVRVILPGRCYRHEQVTTRAECQFHQIEGLMVGPDVRLSDLKGVLLRFARRMFGSDRVRMRGSYFPFTEPSVEVDMRCTLCGGSGCRVCKQSGWLELGGAGLVHPVVLKNGGYDPEKVRGIAFGMGIDRTFMLLHGVPDIRYLFQNDLRFLTQFG
ncbi:MAG: phenylalanine--tRNA ligase subunit alpha [Myxococcota bacterium]|nr:phenylalanine--tRNA ligase subunit alpha [Myxococcota bacterium]